SCPGQPKDYFAPLRCAKCPGNQPGPHPRLRPAPAVGILNNFGKPHPFPSPVYELAPSDTVAAILAR
ncbi:MAG: hypothetical protein ACKV2V_22155, partial [Blastocatellia bacterium]